MIRKIQHAATKQPAPQSVYDRFSAADDVLGTRVSSGEIVFPVKLHLEYVPFGEVQWMYIRTEAHRVTLGCCAGDIEEHRLMLVGRNGLVAAVPFDRLSYAEAAIGLIRKAAPHIAIGFTAENRARFGVAEPAV